MLAFFARTLFLLAATFGIGAIAGRMARARARRNGASPARERQPAEAPPVRAAANLGEPGSITSDATAPAVAPTEAARTPASIGQPSFAGYGGSGFVAGASSPAPRSDAAPASLVQGVEGATPLAAPDLHGRTPTPDERSALAEDPLARLHQTDTLDFKTVDYGNMKAAARTAAEAASRDDGWTVPEGYHLGGSDIHVESPAAFKSFGGSGAMHGAPEPVLDPLNTGEQENETASSPPSRLDAARGGVPDDLTRISGIGQSIERLLFDNGVFHFDQIAEWTADNMRWANELSGFQGRVEREEWVDQAKILASERTAG